MWWWISTLWRVSAFVHWLTLSTLPGCTHSSWTVDINTVTRVSAYVHWLTFSTLSGYTHSSWTVCDTADFSPCRLRGSFFSKVRRCVHVYVCMCVLCVRMCLYRSCAYLSVWTLIHSLVERQARGWRSNLNRRWKSLIPSSQSSRLHRYTKSITKKYYAAKRAGSSFPQFMKLPKSVALRLTTVPTSRARVHTHAISRST
jgi:hypothetical protein